MNALNNIRFATVSLMVGFLNGLQADLLRRGALSSLDALENIEARSLME